MAQGATTNMAFGWALARHVSADGCQLVVEDSLVMRGQRLAFDLHGREIVSGAVRWVVGDRVGFAFDAPIGSAAMQALQSGGRGANSLELYLLAPQ